jgi:hypothetical protein
MSIRKLIVWVTAIVVAIVGFIAASSPLRKSEDDIRAWLETQTPIGSSLESVISYAQKQKWYDARAQGSDGETGPIYVRGELGEYGLVFATSVTVFWEFDSMSRLERIRIWKTVDAL